MPGNVAAPAPTDTFPTFFYASFTMEMRVEALLQSYPDGSSTRAALAVNPRHFFKIVYAVTPSQWTTLFTFFLAHQGVAFHFYNLLESLPGPPPGDPTGRYAVAFDGPWSEELRLGRTMVSLNLREVYEV
jgi:hypothetical protein